MKDLICSASTRMLVTSSRVSEKDAESKQQVCDMTFVYQNYKSLVPTDQDLQLMKRTVVAETPDGETKEVPKDRLGKMEARVSLAEVDFSESPQFDPSMDQETFFSEVRSLDNWLVPIDIVNRASQGEEFQASSLDDKNFVDSLIMGETVHSWINGRNEKEIYLTRYTTSNLPITDVTINYLEMRVALGFYWKSIDSIKFKFEYLPIIFDQKMEARVIHLHLVKTGSESRNKTKTGAKAQDGTRPSKDRRAVRAKELEEEVEMG